MTPRGKRAALALLGLAIAASVVLAYEARGYLQESWWIWRLRSTDLESRNEAAQKLADRKCVRAIPEMLRLIAADSKEGITAHKARVVTLRCSMGGPLAFRTTHYRMASPLVLALWKMGEGALPALEIFSSDGLPLSDKGRIHRILEELRKRDEPMSPWLAGVEGR